VDSRAPSIAWTGDLKRFVNLDPEDASEGSDEAMIEKTPSGHMGVMGWESNLGCGMWLEEIEMDMDS
jgi:hypothetical protein